MKVTYNGVRAEMARRRVSQLKLAEMLNVHYNTVNNWLSGRNDPGLGSVIEALRAIGMSDEQILNMRIGDLVMIEDNGKAPVD